jgi:hypothetical protein
MGGQQTPFLYYFYMTTDISFGNITPYFTLSEPELFISFCSEVFKSEILKCDKDSSKKN